MIKCPITEFFRHFKCDFPKTFQPLVKKFIRHPALRSCHTHACNNAPTRIINRKCKTSNSNFTLFFIIGISTPPDSL